MWVLATVLGIFLFFALLLAIPVDVTFRVEKSTDFKSRVRVRWLFGLIGKDISGEKKKREKEKKKGNIKPLLAVLRTRRFPRKLFKFARSTFPLLKVRELKLNLRVGLDDPAETGLLFAIIGPMMVYIRSLPLLDIQVEPDFEGESLRGHFRGDIRAFPIQFVGLCIPLALSPTTIRAIKAMVAARRR